MSVWFIRNGVRYRFRKTCKSMADILIRLFSFSFGSVILKGARFDSSFWSVYALITKFTLSKIPNSLLKLWVNAVACSEIQTWVSEWPTYISTQKSERIACSGLQSNKFWFLNTIILHRFPLPSLVFIHSMMGMLMFKCLYRRSGAVGKIVGPVSGRMGVRIPAATYLSRKIRWWQLHC